MSGSRGDESMWRDYMPDIDSDEDDDVECGPRSSGSAVSTETHDVGDRSTSSSGKPSKDRQGRRLPTQQQEKPQPKASNLFKPKQVRIRRNEPPEGGERQTGDVSGKPKEGGKPQPKASSLFESRRVRIRRNKPPEVSKQQTGDVPGKSKEGEKPQPKASSLFESRRVRIRRNKPPEVSKQQTGDVPGKSKEGERPQPKASSLFESRRVRIRRNKPPSPVRPGQAERVGQESKTGQPLEQSADKEHESIPKKRGREEGQGEVPVAGVSRKKQAANLQNFAAPTRRRVAPVPIDDSVYEPEQKDKSMDDVFKGPRLGEERSDVRPLDLDERGGADEMVVIDGNFQDKRTPHIVRMDWEAGNINRDALPKIMLGAESSATLRSSINTTAQSNLISPPLQDTEAQYYIGVALDDSLLPVFNIKDAKRHATDDEQEPNPDLYAPFVVDAGFAVQNYVEITFAQYQRNMAPSGPMANRTITIHMPIKHSITQKGQIQWFRVSADIIKDATAYVRSASLNTMVALMEYRAQ